MFVIEKIIPSSPPVHRPLDKAEYAAMDKALIRFKNERKRLDTSEGIAIMVSEGNGRWRLLAQSIRN